ncbi:MAG TPA: L,D-transpeptidase family protein [Candidatus Xenobia bacterium]|jgi:L,D-transpeptidase ErfK/SrfK
MRHVIWLILSCMLACPVAAAPLGLPPVVGQDRLHTVQEGETLPGLAQRFRLAMEHIAFANRLPIDQYIPDIDLGTTVVLPLRRILPVRPPLDGLVINLPERGAYLFRHGQFRNFYPIAMGRPGFETPRGTFYVIEKTKNPTWVPPAWAKVRDPIYPPGPNNPLGDRWIGLSSHGLGIHGTTSPEAIGMDISHGCIRMYPDLVRELFDQVSVGMTVRIEYEPVKVGYDRDTGSVCMAVYPDVYGLADPQHRAQALMSGRGVPARRWSPVVQRHSGRVVSLMADRVEVVVDGHQVALLHGPVRRDGALWLPLPVLTAAGAGVTSGPTGLRLDVGSQTATLGPTDVYRQGGDTLVSVATLHNLGIRYDWEAATDTLSIHPPAKHPPSPSPLP